jgi:hypothetical protein
MRLHDAVQLLARHLYLRPGRTQTVASRLQDAGLISKTEGSRRYPDDVSREEIVALFIAAVTETSLGAAAESTANFAALTDCENTRFDQAITDLLFNEDLLSGDVAIHVDPPAATVSVDGIMVVFGPDAPSAGASQARFIAANTIAALRADLNTKEI